MPFLRNLERQVTDAIHRQFSKRSASEDDLLEDIRAIFDAESARAEKPARESRSSASQAPSDDEEGNSSNEDTDEPPLLDLDPKLPTKTLKQEMLPLLCLPSLDRSLPFLRIVGKDSRSRPLTYTMGPSTHSAPGGRRLGSTSTPISHASRPIRSGSRPWAPY